MSHTGENEGAQCREAKLSELGRAYAAALLTGDEVAAEVAIRDALDARLDTGEIDDAIIAPAMWLVGELWERGEISIAEEHIATEISIRVLALHSEAKRVRRARRRSRVMLATPAGELHVVALRMTGDLLRDAGFDVVMVGADVPPTALAASARRHHPDVVCLSSTMPGGGDEVMIAVDEVQRVAPGVGFVIGGQGLTSRLRGLPRIEVCDRVSHAVEAVDAVVQRADLN